MILPEGMTAEKLREVADWLDTYDSLATSYISLIHTLRVKRDITTIVSLLETVQSKDVQADLRRWADDIDWGSV